MKRFSLFLCYLILMAASCIEPYNLPVISSAEGLLVVEGFINPNGPTDIKLSHTSAVNAQNNQQLPELKAHVVVEGEDNSTYALTEKGNGLYSIDHMQMNQTKKYRAKIKTQDQKVYVSDFVEVKRTPSIDSVTWEIDYKNSGIQFYVYTHDTENGTHYYQWDFEETWHYHTVFPTHFDYINGQIIFNPEKENIYDCFKTEKNNVIHTTSTNALSQDIVYRFPLQFIPANSAKLEIGYRILVKQYALTRDACDYLTELKKNTEQRGSLFDQQPSHLLGNVHFVSNPEEPVLGFVSGHDWDEESVFILRVGSLPAWFNGKTVYTECVSDPPFVTDGPAYTSLMLNNGAILPYDGGLAPAACVDCRKKGGTNKKPEYWPY